MTSPTFASVEFVVVVRPIPIVAPAQFVADPAVRDCLPSVRLVAVHAAAAIRIVEVIAGTFATRKLAPL